MTTDPEIAALITRLRTLAADHDLYEQGGGAAAELEQAADAIEALVAKADAATLEAVRRIAVR